MTNFNHFGQMVRLTSLPVFNKISFYYKTLTYFYVATKLLFSDTDYYLCVLVFATKVQISKKRE